MVEEPQEPEYRFTEMPDKVEIGSVASCPKCRQTGKEPGNKTGMPCSRCNGFGIVPNRGPIESRKPAS